MQKQRAGAVSATTLETIARLALETAQTNAQLAELQQASPHLDRHALTALRLDGLRQRRRIAGGPGVQHDEEAFLGEFLGYGATVSPGRDERWCRSARPSVGQHSEEVLDEAGYST